MKKVFYLLTLKTALLLTACDIINPDEEIPAYVTVEPFEFTTGSDQGSDSEKIVDAWVFVGTSFFGNFTLPATFPVLETGEQELILFPGIKDNGISSTPDIYTLYKDFRTTVDLQPNQDVTISPSTSYEDNAVFKLVEGFEGSSQAFREYTNVGDSVPVEIIQAESFEGNGSGRIRLNLDRPTIDVGTPQFLEFPSAGLAAYVELDYKTEIPFAMYIRAYDAFGSQIYQDELLHTVSASDEWNKIYFNFTDSFTLMRIVNPTSYQILIRSVLPIENGEFVVDEATILLDNIKFVHF